jgi:hypothetical protein
MVPDGRLRAGSEPPDGCENRGPPVSLPIGRTAVQLAGIAPGFVGLLKMNILGPSEIRLRPSPPESLKFDMAELVERSIAEWYGGQPPGTPSPEVESVGGFYRG